MEEIRKNQKVKFTKEKQLDFIKHYLNNNQNVTQACKSVGISKVTFYNTIKLNDEFKAKLDSYVEFYAIIFKDSFMEGLHTNDLKLRYKYLSLLPQSTIANLFNLASEAAETNIRLLLDKGDIEIT